MNHYLLEPVARRGIAILGLNTRYLGSDVSLLLERAIQDLGAGLRWLRAQGYERILLIGNSGGGAFVSLYQSQAERLSIYDTPAGDPIDLKPDDLPPADGIALSAAHLGRSRLMETWIDPAVVDEQDPLPTDPVLDMFNPKNGPPYSEEFLQRYTGCCNGPDCSVSNDGLRKGCVIFAQRPTDRGIWRSSCIARWPTRAASIHHSTRMTARLGQPSGVRRECKITPPIAWGATRP